VRHRPDLVEECQRAGVTLECDPDEVAHRALHLTLGLARQPERGQRLDVETLVPLQQL